MKVENSTRAFGCPLKYIQGPGEFSNIAAFCRPYGEKAFFLIDGFLFENMQMRLHGSFADSDQSFMAQCFGGECCQEEIDRVAQEVERFGANILVGVGGGKTCDTVKLVSDREAMPRILVPTSASSDAPCTEVAILYSPEGEHLKSIRLRQNSEIILVDTEIIIQAPARLFYAGMADALATWFEAQACNLSDSANRVGQTGYRRCLAGLEIAKLAYEVILRDGQRAKLALEAGAITEAFENVVEANTLLSGVGFMNTGTAAAHGIHSGLTVLPCTHPYLHGEKVAFGIICQLVLENAPDAEVERIVRFLISLDLPVTLGQLNVEVTPENIRAIAHKTAALNPLVHAEPFRVTEDMVYSAILAANAIGATYLAAN